MEKTSETNQTVNFRREDKKPIKKIKNIKPTIANTEFREKI